MTITMTLPFRFARQSRHLVLACLGSNVAGPFDPLYTFPRDTHQQGQHVPMPWMRNTLGFNASSRNSCCNQAISHAIRNCSGTAQHTAPLGLS